MEKKLQRVGRVAAALLAMACAASSACGAIINMTAYVLNPLYQQDGVTPLPDGSVVQIIGSTDGFIDPPETWGGTNLTGNTTGDDVILATIPVDSSVLGIPGTFYVSGIYYDNTVINYAYIRFYTTTGTIGGLLYWGETPIQNIEYDAFGTIFVDFEGGYSATNQNNFVVIPEPSTTCLLVVAIFLVFAVRSAAQRGCCGLFSKRAHAPTPVATAQAVAGGF